MSAYINLYLKPKKREDESTEPKPMLFMSACSADPLYEAFSDAGVVWSSSDEEEEFTEITAAFMSSIISESKADIDKWDKRIGELEKHADGNIDIINEIIEDKEYLEELNNTYMRLCCIRDIVTELVEFDYCDFDGMLANRS